MNMNFSEDTLIFFFSSITILHFLISNFIGFYFLLLLAFLFVVVESKYQREYTGSTIRSQIYSSALGFPCVRLLYNNRTIGCTQSTDTVSGTLQLLKGSVSNFTPNHGATVAVLEPNDFTRDNILTLSQKGGVTGIVILWGQQTGLNISNQESQIPNEAEGLTSFKWNPSGNGLSWESFSLPIWLAHENYTKLLRSRAMANDQGAKPLWGLSLNTKMDAGTDTETCLRRGRCLPVGGQSIISSIEPPSYSKPVIFVTSTMDSNSFFHDSVPGVEAHLSGTIALIAAEIALGSFPSAHSSNLTSDVVFSYFTGEAWGYLGSRRFVHDLAQFNCSSVNVNDTNLCDEPYMSSMIFQKIGLSKASLVVDVSQVGHLDSLGTLFVHTSKDEKQTLDSFKSTTLYSGDLSVSYVYTNPDSSRGLPPSPAMSFLRQIPTIPAVVIADHEREFTNKQYHSHNDYLPLNSTQLCEVSTLIARTIYTLANSGSPDISQSITADCSLIEELVYCLTYDFKCKLTQHYLGLITTNDPSNLVRLSEYTGVFGTSSSTIYLHARSKFLRWLLLDKLANVRGPKCNKTSQCEIGYMCVGVSPNSTCLKGATVYHDAMSLGIKWDTKKETWKITDKSEPLWTESYWNTLFLELFTKDDDSHDNAVLACGIIEFVLAFIVVAIIKIHFINHYKFTSIN